MGRSIVIMLLVFAPSLAIADRCWMTGGCEGTIGYMHVPQSQLAGASIFNSHGIPKVDSVVVLKVNGHFFGAGFLDDDRFRPLLSEAVRRGSQLEAGGELASGAKVRILGYRGVEVDGTDATALLALVYVITDH